MRATGAHTSNVKVFHRLADDLTHLEDRQDDRHGDESNDRTHHNDHDRFNHRGDRLDVVAQLLRVEDRYLVEHLAELTGLLTSGDHLHHRFGEQRRARQRHRDLFAFLHRREHGAPQSLVEPVAADVAGDGDRVEHRHTRVDELAHRLQAAADVQRTEHRAEDRRPQLHAVPPEGADLRLQEEEETNRAAEQEPNQQGPVRNDERAQAHEERRRPGQRIFLAFEDARELGQHERQQEDRHADRHRADDAGVDHRADDHFLGFDLLRQVERDAVEHLAE